MNSSDDFIHQIREYFHSLTKKHFDTFFEDDSEKLYGIYLKTFNDLWENNLELMPNDLGKRHGMNPIFVMALAEALEQMDTQLDKLQTHVLAIYRIILSDILIHQQKQLSESENPWIDFINSTKKGNEQIYNNEYFNLDYLENSNDCFGFDLHRCFYYEIFEKNCRSDLAPILCMYDWILADAIEQWVSFERKETIAHGQKKCTFRYFPKIKGK